MLDIVRAEVRDIDRIIELRHSIEDWLASRRVVQWTPREIPDSVFRDQVARGEYYVARLDGRHEVVGALRLLWFDRAMWQDDVFAGYVYVEDLCVKGLARTRLAKSVHDAGWGMFTRMLEEKAARYGRTFARVDRWFPSTRMCSVCGAVGEKKPLHVREWTCLCGTTHDRDVNAAKNILAAGRADSSTPVELVSDMPSGAQPAVKQEPTGSAA